MEKQKELTKTEIKELSVIKPNYIRIRLDYRLSLLFEYKDGIAFLNTLEKAERWNTDDYNNPKITTLNWELTTNILSNSAYVKNKMNQLLGIPTGKPEDEIE